MNKSANHTCLWKRASKSANKNFAKQAQSLKKSVHPSVGSPPQQKSGETCIIADILLINHNRFIADLRTEMQEH